MRSRKHSRFASWAAMALFLFSIGYSYLLVFTLLRLQLLDAMNPYLRVFVQIFLTAYLVILGWTVLDWPTARSDFYKLIGIYERPLILRFRLFRNIVVLVCPLIAFALYFFSLGFSYPDKAAAYMGPAAIMLSAATATIGWLFSSYQSQHLHRKQHTLNIVLKLVDDKELKELTSEIRLATARYYKNNGLEAQLISKQPEPIELKEFRPSEGSLKDDDDDDDAEAFLRNAINMLNFLEYIALGVRTGDLDSHHIRKTMKSTITRNYWVFEKVIEAYADVRPVTISKIERKLSQTQFLENFLWLINLYAEDDWRKTDAEKQRRPILPPDY